MYATVKIVWATLFLWPVALVYMHQMHKEVGFLLYFGQTFVTGHHIHKGAYWDSNQPVPLREFLTIYFRYYNFQFIANFKYQIIF